MRTLIQNDMVLLNTKWYGSLKYKMIGFSQIQDDRVILNTKWYGSLKYKMIGLSQMGYIVSYSKFIFCERTLDIILWNT